MRIASKWGVSLWLSMAMWCATPLRAQLAFRSAVDLALRNSPRVKSAEADVAKAVAGLQESRDVYIPAFNLGSGLGYTYGFPIGQPSVYNASLQSLIFDQSQRNYIRAARLALEAANAALQDVRQQVAEDAANTYLAADADQQRLRALRDEETYAADLVRITTDRLNAGTDPAIELTRARLSAAQIRLHRIQVEDELRTHQDHLARLTGVSNVLLHTDHDSLPAIATTEIAPDEVQLPSSIRAAYLRADSQRQMAFGDARKMYRPQVGLGIQYSRFAQFNNYLDYYTHFQHNNFQAGLQLNLPVFDFTRRAHARVSLAESERLRHDADVARDQFFEGRLKSLNAQTELAAQSDVAVLQRQLAQDQLEIVQVQLQQGNPNGQPVTPKDRSTAQIEERQRYLDVLNADLQLRQQVIGLLRSTGQLEHWLQSLPKQ